MNNEIMSYFVSILTSTFVSVLTVFFTIKLEYRKNIDIEIFKQQKCLYLKFLNILLDLQKNPNLQFEKMKYDEIEKLQSEYMIIASEKCKKDFITIKKYISYRYKDFENEFYNETVLTENEILLQNDEFYFYEIESNKDNYINKHRITEDDFCKLINNAIKNIRKSLKIS